MSKRCMVCENGPVYKCIHRRCWDNLTHEQVTAIARSDARLFALQTVCFAAAFVLFVWSVVL